jgi:hypothetical protein
MTRLKKTRYLALAVILSGLYTALAPGDVRGAALTCEGVACGNPGCSGAPPNLAAECGIWNLAVACNPTIPCYEDGYFPGNYYWCEHDM